jgi:Asp-tRNA(Asn)/Glu-tRNA(Gln) amidotransferase A subunit family amidase
MGLPVAIKDVLNVEGSEMQLLPFRILKGFLSLRRNCRSPSSGGRSHFSSGRTNMDEFAMGRRRKIRRIIPPQSVE